MSNGISYHLVRGCDGHDNVVALFPNKSQPLKQADSSHPHWDTIVRGLQDNDESVYELFDVIGGVMKQFNQITERISWDGENVLWDGDPIHTVLSDQLMRVIESGDSEAYTALARFWEKLETNPNDHSRQQAYDFLASHKFQITPEGDVVGYKGVSKDADGVFYSTASSRVAGKPSAYVNGEPIPELRTVPQNIGDVVSMPRAEVVHDPSRACERGLHVATRSYAESYGRNGAVLEVHVNPRDIVSVPKDGGGAKVRVWRYKVARVAVDGNSNAPVLRSEPENVWAGDVGYRPE